MLSRIERSIDLNATPAQVWAVLTDFAAYAQWNPFIREAAGEARVGAELRVTMQPQGHGKTALRPKVLVANPERELRWRGHVLIPGIFDGEHHFRIEPLGEGRVRFTQEESFGGILLPFFGGTLRDSEKSFAAMNEALRARVEALSAVER
jgi:hypothetical protein